MKNNTKQEKRQRRQKRIRSRVFGTSLRPRLSIFKSNRYIVLQLINDDKGDTLAYTSTKDIKTKVKNKAFEAGIDIATKAKAKKINKVVFDRGGYIYTGSVAKVAAGAREGGLEF